MRSMFPQARCRLREERKPKAGVRDRAKSYARFLEGHVGEEERHVFPLAERC